MCVCIYIACVYLFMSTYQCAFDEINAFCSLRRDISDIMRFIRRPCPPGFAVANDFLGSCYRFSEEGKEVLWIDAVNTCYNHSAYLVEIHSQEEFDYLLPMMKERGGDFWLGGSDIQHEGKWTWRRTRLNFRFSKWGGMEPNGTVVENCLRAYQGYGYLWGDAHCGKDPTAFICEYDTKLK